MGINCFFAGQGAQFPGMGLDLAQADADVMKCFDDASATLGFDIKKICFEGPEEALTASDVCQPAIFIVSTACYRALRKRCPNLEVSAMGGLSLGEWTALHAAGVLDFETTLKILRVRGTYMQEACVAHPSGMVSVMGATPEQIKTLCDETGCTISNYNSDAQQVLAGTHEAVAAAAEKAGAAGLRAIVLQVAGAFHSPFMQSAREKLAAFVADIPFAKPQVPVLSNATGTFHVADGEAIKAAMLRQVTDSVLFYDCVKQVMQPEGSRFVEFGPGKVLSGLIRRINKANEVANVQDSASLEVVATRLA